MKDTFNLIEVKSLLTACFGEFCECVGDRLSGCDVCPYRAYYYANNKDESACHRAYVDDFLNQFKEL